MADYDRSFVPLPIFCGDNYDFWSIKMRTYFRSQNLWKVVKEGFNIPENASTLTATQKKELEDDQQKDSQALFALQQALVDDIFFTNHGCIKCQRSMGYVARGVSKK